MIEGTNDGASKEEQSGERDGVLFEYGRSAVEQVTVGATNLSIIQEI